MTYCAYVQVQILLFRVALSVADVGTALGGASSVFPGHFNGIHPSAKQCHMKKHVSLQLP